ncbi:hypothetical protein AVEN_257713-1 [Araneus ventricosus]|uniref:Uncharacterized protein n=1 Tax=Araneus ventricosus TaxID=182803 RepID=A0A4Y2LII1_ARAVE|nr:hypothetical protein AVEN_257713-1 [Araneus ventricosus]
MVDILLQKDDVFRKYFTAANAEPNVTESEDKLADEIFQKTFPNYDKKDFKSFYYTYLRDKNLAAMHINDDSVEPSEICNKLAYDPSKRGFIKIPRVSNYGKGKREKIQSG